MKRVFIAPLDWGLGHATRCIPVIRKFVEMKCETFIGGCGDSLELLKKEFPRVQTVDLPAYNPVYPRSGSMVWSMARQLPKFIRAIRDEHRAIENIVKEKQIDVVVSDNRYGLWTGHARTALITHQSNIMMPKRFGWLQPVIRYFNHRQLRRFSVCWIPDFPESKSLAGELAFFGSRDDLKFEHIGVLSRFRRISKPPVMHYQVLVILSGPEPQRTILEELILPQLEEARLTYFVVRGKITGDDRSNNPNVADYLTTELLLEKISAAEVVVSRSGYSSVMDLATLGKKAIFIPTPGQTEQEYLAKRLNEKKICFSIEQEKFNLKTAVAESKNYSGFTRLEVTDILLTKAIDQLIGQNNP